MIIDWQEVIATLGSTTVVVVAVGYLAKSIISHLLNRDLARAERCAKEAEQEREIEFKKIIVKYTKDVETIYAKDERIRQELIRWAPPISRSVNALSYRLDNILYNDGYLALSSNCINIINPNWSIKHEYFMSSTEYIFCRYYCYVELLKEELNFELFYSHTKKYYFLEKVRAVDKALSSFPHKEMESDKFPRLGDMQIFNLQQKLLGEIVMVRDRNLDRCMKYSEFLLRRQELNCSGAFDPLVAFLKELNPTNKHRWCRLVLMKRALDELSEECRTLIDDKRIENR